MDYDKYRYMLIKKEQKARKAQKEVKIKEIRLRPNISPNDLQIKVKRAREFLIEKNKVKLSLQFMGRESLHSELGMQILNSAIKQLADIGTIEQAPKREQRNIVVLLNPIK